MMKTTHQPLFLKRNDPDYVHFGKQTMYLVKQALVTTALTMVFVIVCTLQTFAQDVTVSGRVTDTADNTPLPGVNVTVKGTTNGTVTDPNGSYSISVPGNSTIVFSYIGYTTQEIPVNNRSTINVALGGDVQALSEVVVIGYGEQRKQDATGAVVALSPKEFNKGIISSPEQLLQGRAAGIQVTPASGEPGAGINIRIRGTTSVRSGNNPLFVVDGVPLDGGNVADGGRDFGAGTQSARNPLNFLNPEDIENISVLKDASAAAIYGSRGANGVVLITTKRGRAGQQNLNVSASTGFASTLRRYDLLSAAEYPDAVRSAGGDPSSPAVNAGASTDWQDEIFRTGLVQNYNVSYGGGNDNTRYLFSIGYLDQDGIVEKSNLRRLTGRVNASHEILNDKIVFDVALTTSSIRDIYVPNTDNAGFQGNLIGAAIQANPTYPVRDAEGRYFNPDGYQNDLLTDKTVWIPRGNAFRNPVAMLEGIDDQGDTRRTLANLGATWRIIDGLSYKATLGLDVSASERRTSVRPNLPGFELRSVIEDGVQYSGLGVIQNRIRNSVLNEHTLTYNRRIGENSSLDVLAGYSYQIFQNRGNFAQSELFVPAALAIFPYTNNLGGVNNREDNKAYNAGSDRDQSELQSFFGRINYSLKDKYLLTATLRRDGSSKFGENNKYGNFPSFAAGWRISEEAFMPEGIFDDLKLRANWGVTGNQEFGSTLTRNRFGFDPNNLATPRDITPNPNLKWERTTQWGIGLDFALLGGRLSGSTDYFNKNTTDLLIEAFYAQPAPARSRFINLPANIINSGVELQLNYDIFPEGRFQWNVSANTTFLRNEVTNFGGLYLTGEIRGQGLSGANAQRIVGGRPLNGFFLPTFVGYNEQGLGVYTDPTLALEYVGSPFPTMNFGLTNNFTFDKLSLSVFFTGATGFYVYNNTANAIFTKGNLRNGRNVTEEAASSPENAINPPLPSTRFLEKGDFARLANFTLAYDFGLPENVGVKNLRVYLTGQNVLLFTGYSGIDPEVSTNASRDGIPSTNMDYLAFPSARTFTLGVNLGF
jgi:TonB-dependent starch-binding outer membrane protein SusC